MERIFHRDGIGTLGGQGETWSSRSYRKSERIGKVSDYFSGCNLTKMSVLRI